MAANIFSAVKHGLVSEVVVSADLDAARIEGKPNLFRCADGVLRNEAGFKATANSLVRYARKHGVSVVILRPAPVAVEIDRTYIVGQFVLAVQGLASVGVTIKPAVVDSVLALPTIDLIDQVKKARAIWRDLYAAKMAA